MLRLAMSVFALPAEGNAGFVLKVQCPLSTSVLTGSSSA